MSPRAYTPKPPWRKPLRVVGIDPSLTSTGIALPDGLTIAIQPRKLRGPERLAHLAAAVRWASISADLAVIEGYAFGSKYRREALGELGGVIRTSLWENRVPFVEIPPPTLKLFATGNGKASKDEVAEAACRDLDSGPGLTSDEYDALWLKEAGHCLLSGPNHGHPEALSKIELPEGLK